VFFFLRYPPDNHLLPPVWEPLPHTLPYQWNLNVAHKAGFTPIIRIFLIFGMHWSYLANSNSLWEILTWKYFRQDLSCRPGMGTYLLSRAAWLMEYRWPGGKSNFILKFCLHLPKGNKERKLCHRARDTSLGLLFTCLPVMEFRFDAMLYSNSGNENSDAGHIKCSRELQVPHPCSRLSRRLTEKQTHTQ